jgi:3-ketosteroid 9alpha-monooxygenase subunit A
MNGLPNMQPTGWFQVAWSADLEVGDVTPLHYFGAELVVFRDLDGVVHVLDAHCQHLGANLSRGGCVVEGGIQCPFHGWVWSGDGRNVRIPYEPAPNRACRVRSWPVTELNECVYLWHDLARRDPLWCVPDAWRVLDEHIGGQYFRPVGPRQHDLFRRVTVHPQVVVETAVDAQHFRFVHHTPVTPTVLAETSDECTWHTTAGFGDTTDTIEIYWSGIGLSFTGERTCDEVRVISVCPTPVDECCTDIFATYWVSDSGDYDQRLRGAKQAVCDDVGIWAYQRYLDRPGLAPSEATGFGQLRSWARGFYPHTAVAEPRS